MMNAMKAMGAPAGAAGAMGALQGKKYIFLQENTYSSSKLDIIDPNKYPFNTY